MIPPVQMVAWIVDAGMVSLTAWLGVRRVGYSGVSRIEVALAWGLLALMLIVGSGVLLGAVGGLSLPGFVLTHGASLAVVAVPWRRHLKDDLLALRALMRSGRVTMRTSGPESCLTGLLIAVGLASVLLAFVANPVVFDALTYRLSRIGHWLQDGRISEIATDDARLNYMPVAPDLVMGWFLTGTGDGFHAAAVAQALGGMLTLAATVGLGRLTGLGRSAALGAAVVVLGLPNAAPQFTSTYTDLFTTGVLSAAFYLWLMALRRGRGSWLGGAGAGLALASKGTVVYFAPGLLVAVAWLAWRYPASRSAWVRTLLGGALAVALFLGPSLVRNYRSYGGWIGPADFVVWHHGATPGLHGSVEKLKFNLASAFAQLCEPNSQPPWWRWPARTLGEGVIARLPEQDPYAFDGLDRRANLRKIYAIAAPDADVTSTGLLLPVLGVLAAITALFGRPTPGREFALIWTSGIVGFVLYLHWRVQWSPYLFRFLVLATPWLSVLAVWWVGLLPRWARIGMWTILGATTAHGFGAAWFDTYQSGWPAYVRPGQSTGYHVYQHWRAWSAELDQPAEPLRVALPMNLPLAAFYRQQLVRTVDPLRLSALAAKQSQDAVSAEDGWLIVPAMHFLGREGDVMARVWLHEGDERSAFSLAAFRALRPGEHPVPLLYRNRVISTASVIRHELRVRSWVTAPVRLQLFNPGRTPCHFVLIAPSGAMRGEVAPGMRLWVEAEIPAGIVSSVAVEYARAAPGETFPGRLEVGIVP